MLIIPAENTVNWKRPPWVTLGLMLACLLVGALSGLWMLQSATTSPQTSRD
jgi:carbon starvation protein CstA